MLDRQELETLHSRRFTGTSHDQIAAAANAIMGLGEEWEEVAGKEQELGLHFLSVQCADICYLAREIANGSEFRLLRRRATV